MNRRVFVTGLGAVLAAPFAADAQQTGKVYRIGRLEQGSAGPDAAFRQGLRELGYVEGQNIVIEYRYAGGRTELLPTSPLSSSVSR